jgi:beta-alanine--pyruvate transaminase
LRGFADEHARKRPTSLASQLKLDAHWMPYTANRNFQRDPRLIVGAEGSWLIDDKGRKVYDSLSGLWTCGAGHTRKEIQEAVAKQLGTLDYSPGFQYGHPLSFQLAEKITDLTPGNLNHVFFTDSGSECADTAVKMVRAYWRLKGQSTKTKMIGRARGYHGVNIAGTSLGGVNGNRKTVRPGDDGRRSPAAHVAGEQRLLPWHAGAGRYRLGR